MPAISRRSPTSSACHELKLIVDLIYQGGLNYMRYSVSDTAEHGDYTGGPHIVTDATKRKAMKKMLEDIQVGRVRARAGSRRTRPAGPGSTSCARPSRTSSIEQVGRRLRALMPFLKPVTVRQDTGKQEPAAV